MSRKNSSTKFAAQNLITKFALFPLGIISSVLIARMLGVEGKGVYSYVTLLSSLFIPILSFGYGAGVIYQIGTKAFDIKGTTLTNIIVSVLQAAFIAACVACAWYFGYLGKTGEQIGRIEIGIIIALIFLNTVFQFTSKSILADSWFKLDNLLQILRKIIIPTCVVLLILFSQNNVRGGLIGLLGGVTFLLLLQQYNLWKKYRPTFAFNKDFAKKSYAYGFKGWIGNIAITANTRIDQLILGGVASAEVLGSYSIAVLLSELIWILPAALGQVIYNRVAGDNNQTTSLKLVKKIHRILLSFLLLCTFAAAIVGPYIIPFVYGSEYSGAILPFLVLLPGTLIMVSTKLLAKLFTASGHIAVTNKVQIISSIVSIVLYIILIPQMGILGAAIAATIGYTIGAVAFWYYYKKTYSERLFDLFKVKRSDIKWAYERCLFLWNRIKRK